VCFLLAAHRSGFALVGIEQPRFLFDGAAVFDDPDLPPDVEAPVRAELDRFVEQFSVAWMG